MSDNPTSGEWWTEQDVDGCWHIGTGNRGFAELDEFTAKAIADTHNAALATEREMTQKLIDQTTSFREQLAAEREKVRHVIALLENPKFDDWDRRELLKALHLLSRTTDPATGETITKPTWAELGAMNQELQQLRSQVQTLRDALTKIADGQAQLFPMQLRAIATNALAKVGKDQAGSSL